MNNVTRQFSHTYYPARALVVYQKKNGSAFYVESFRFDNNNKLVDAHPMSQDEADSLAGVLQDTPGKDKKRSKLKPEGLLPEKCLFLDQSNDYRVIWYTPPREENLFFVESLGIPSGKAFVPPMLWAASKKTLNVFALHTTKRPDVSTSLYQAPFFNTSANGLVCIGTAKVEFPKNCSLDEFMTLWETAYFNSYFSHANHGILAKSNVIELWKSLIGTDRPFPVDQLRKVPTSIQSLIP